MAKTITQKMKSRKRYKTHGEHSLLIAKQINQKTNVYPYYSGQDAKGFLLSTFSDGPATVQDSMDQETHSTAERVGLVG